MTSGIDKLPKELLSNITFYLSSRDNANLRLCSRALSSAATKLLFTHITLSPTGRSTQSLTEILEASRLAPLVRKLTVNCDTSALLHPFGDELQTELPEYFYDVLNRTKELPNLQEAGLEFDNRCTGHEHRPEDVFKAQSPQSIRWRALELTRFFALLLFTDRKTDIRGLSIKYLQNINDPKIKNLRDALLGKLRTLRLQFLFESNPSSPEHNLRMPEPHQFMAELPSVWLTPAQHLTNLTLFCTDYFGYCPKLDLRGVHFPALTSLAFGNYTFTHDWQTSWITSHVTLRKLILDDCIIIPKLCVFNEVDAENYRTSDYRTEDFLLGNEGYRTWTYDRRWHHIFARFQAELPRLDEFRFGSGDWSAGRYPRHRCFEWTELLPISLVQPGQGGRKMSHYLFFMERGAPSPYCKEWWEDNDGEEEGFEVLEFVDCLEEDYKALVGLLKTIGQVLPTREEVMGEAGWPVRSKERERWAFTW